VEEGGAGVGVGDQAASVLSVTRGARRGSAGGLWGVCHAASVLSVRRY
jgi:hypothetical protein